MTRKMPDRCQWIFQGTARELQWSICGAARAARRRRPRHARRGRRRAPPHAVGGLAAARPRSSARSATRCSSRPGAASGSRAAAHVLLGHADALFAQLERLEGELAAQDAAPRGEVRIGGFPTALAGLLAPAARPLRAVAPAVTLRVQEAETDEAVALLVARDVDVILGMECSRRAAPRRHPLPPRGAARRHPRRGAADRSPARRPRPDRPRRARATRSWVAPPVGWSCDEVFLAGCRAAGLQPAGRAPRGRLAGGDGARRRRARASRSCRGSPTPRRPPAS